MLWGSSSIQSAPVHETANRRHYPTIKDTSIAELQDASSRSVRRHPACRLRGTCSELTPLWTNESVHWPLYRRAQFAHGNSTRSSARKLNMTEAGTRISQESTNWIGTTVKWADKINQQVQAANKMHVASPSSRVNFYNTTAPFSQWRLQWEGYWSAALLLKMAINTGKGASHRNRIRTDMFVWCFLRIAAIAEMSLDL